LTYTVKAVSEIAGVSVRTLHHYDHIGLLRPAQRGFSGYRLYTEEDLERLQQVLFFRELGFGLHEIKEIIDRPDFDRRKALLKHKELLLERRERLTRLVQLVDRTLEAMEEGVEMDEREMFEGFDQERLEEEARQRWGGTEEFEESIRRTRSYTKVDWAAIQEEGKEVLQGIASLTDRAPSDPEVQQWIGRHHKHINDRFYRCSLKVYRGLGDLYVEDERFKAFFERIKPGMAWFMRDAMHAYCDRLEGE
jgi:DNA-binding transcriptional MerR regulator